MVPDGGGDPRGGNADLDALPPDLRAASLSLTDIILPLDGALHAAETLTATGRRLESWEGWVKMRDGGRAKSLMHGGSFALPRDAAQSAQSAAEAMRRAQERWDRAPEYEGAQLYFRLTFC